MEDLVGNDKFLNFKNDLIKLECRKLPKTSYELKVGEWIGINKYCLAANAIMKIGDLYFNTREIEYYFNISEFPDGYLEDFEIHVK